MTTATVHFADGSGIESEKVCAMFTSIQNDFFDRGNTIFLEIYPLEGSADIGIPIDIGNPTAEVIVTDDESK